MSLRPKGVGYPYLRGCHGLARGDPRVPGMAYLPAFWTLSGSKTPAVTGRKGNTNRVIALAEMPGEEEA